MFDLILAKMGPAAASAVAVTVLGAVMVVVAGDLGARLVPARLPPRMRAYFAQATALAERVLGARR